MSQSNMPGVPGMEAMQGAMEFVRNMWGGGMRMPGMPMPALSVDEINRQIADLKAVESWLQLNMNMLRGTIQALEVQGATLAALQAMGQGMAAMTQPADPGAERAASQPGFSFGFPGADKPGAESESEPAPAAETAAPPPVFDPAAMAASFGNPAAWWNMLQDQFKQAVNTAMVADPEPAAASSTVRKSRARPAAKPAAKTRAAKPTPARNRKPATRA
ncbi:MAG: PhaM family polyhydroxyalkanoate granule multifunctional regulatory protein [Noviherbaspirillum sp.]